MYATTNQGILAERTLADASQSNGNAMGVFFCLFERRGRKNLGSYKKRFWVANETDHQLEMYKNDQDHLPLSVFPADDIRGVLYLGCKQNKFYVMTVQTRKHGNIKFRMSSAEARDMWSAAVTTLMDAFSTSNRRKSILGVVINHTRAAGNALGVNIVVDAARLLTDVPNDLLQYVLEAVDIAIANVSVVVRSYDSEMAVPEHYTLCVQDATHGIRRGTQYDPTKCSVIMSVGLYRDELSNNVTFIVTEPEEILYIIQSGVFRNPLIEGWIESNQGCAAACSAIREHLGAKSTFAFTFQWGQNLHDSKKVERYLQRFVNRYFFGNLLLAIKEAVTEIENAMQLQGLPSHAPVGTHTCASSVSGTPHLSHTNLLQDLNVHGERSVVGPSLGDTCAFPFGVERYIHIATPSILCTGVGGTTRPTAVQLLVEYISGFAICLDKNVVTECAQPPHVALTHTAEYERRCWPAFLLVSKYHQVFEQPAITSDLDLREQLIQTGLNIFLSRCLSNCRTLFNSVFDKNIRVVVEWESLLRCYKNLELTLSREDLPRLVSAVTRMYHQRVEHLRRILSDIRGPSCTTGQDDTLYTTFVQCVKRIHVEFVPYPANGSTAALPDPAVKYGALTDYILCCSEANQTVLLQHINQHRHTTASSVFPLTCGACLYPSVLRMGVWCEHYFSKRENIVPSRQDFIEEDVNTDSDGVVGVELDFGDAVAYERSAEIRVLDMRRVVNTIYDSQGNTMNLKISASAISRAVRVFRGAFGGACVSKHDLCRVLTSNLLRLRTLYSRTVDGAATSVLTEVEAIQILRDYCEYEENERDIEVLLHAHFDRAQSMGPQTHGFPPTGASFIQNQSFLKGCEHPASSVVPYEATASLLASPSISASVAASRTYDFQAIAEVALHTLLPREAVVAKKAWRVGFVFGLENTGKTLITNCLRGVALPTVATVGLSQQVVAFKEWVFSLMELGGRLSFRKHWKYYLARIETIDFLVMVVDTQNWRSRKEVYAYLNDVTKRFKRVPLLVIFNNYHQAPRPLLMPELEDSINLDAIREAQPDRHVFTCVCDITAVHSVNRIIPDGLRRTLEELGSALLQSSDPSQRPSIPKPTETPSSRVA